MSKHKNLKRNLLICLLAGSAVMYTLPLHAATSVVANNALPQNGQFFNGNKFIQGTANEKGNGFDFADIGSITKPNDLTMNVHQNEQNAVIKWNDFSVGCNATVNFDYTGKDNFNTLNYVNSGKVSQIYGTINAQHEGYNGNIFIVNTAGVQIGPSAQINVGSLHVSNKYLNESELGDFAGKITPEMINTDKNADAVLMSLGNINATNVTFEGDGRIVIDSERLLNSDGNSKNTNFEVHTDDAGNVLIGYDAYVDTDKDGDGHIDGYKNQDRAFNQNVFVNGQNPKDNVKGYMWVEDVKQLQAINTNLSGNYALRNSIDATATDNGGEGFNPIGLDDSGKVIVNKVDNSDKYGFYGNFDGIDYNIFGLTINRSNEANVGLFGVAHDANINNVTLVGGSITGGSVVGSVVGAALGNTHITNATNSASVTGNTDVGGIVGYSGDDIDDGAGGEITVSDSDTYAHFTNLINTGAVHSNGEDDRQGGTVSNAGGLIGYMYNGTLDGNSYNLGDVSGDGYNVGGLVGNAVNSAIGDGTNLVYNRLDVTGAYNVGGIVGNMEGSTVKYAENSGTVEAEKYKTEYYTYHTGNQTYDDYYGMRDDGISGVEVNVANVGGIVGTSSASNNGKASKIENVTNTANVSSDTDTYNQYGSENEYYIAGNVAGIVGRAEDTDISNATNQENEIRGAHNVGGVAGYFGTSDDNSDNKYTVTNGINDGGDIMATGARAKQGVNNSNLVNDKGFALEQVRSVSGGSETVIIGNMGGVVGYLEGDNVYVTGSANRGIVHSQEITNPNQVLYTSQAANTGGVVGKLDTDRNSDLSDEEKLKGLQGKTITAAVSDSYNTGNISGYTGVGGIIGMMYNGEVANSYNIGAINTTRRPVSDANGDTVNMGGVVGDTTEEAGASAVIYNVYNEGQIGDDEYNYYARHIGGVVGRLSGIVDKAYNTGDIYSGYSVVGGIVGWLYEGTVSNAFNTGNITTVNNDRQNNGSQVGGIAGAVAGYNTYDANVSNRLYNAYNLGTIRSFTGESNYIDMGGIVGKIVAGANNQATVNIENVYTTANLYTNSNNTGIDGTYGAYRDIGSIYGQNSIGTGLTVNNANYVQFENYNNFNDLTYTNNNGRNGENIKIVSYKDRYSHDAYDLVNIDTDNTWSEISGGSVGKGDWRYYDGKTMPILNAFLPNAEDYFSGETGHTNTMNGIDSIQYGTAYNPLLTIINAKVNTDNLTFDWGDLDITGAASIAVYNSGLTLYNVDTSDGTGYYGGLLYSDGDLSLNTSNKDGEAEDGVSGNISLGSGAKLYGSSVDINADGTVTIYGSVTASGNKGESNIKITAGDVNVYGTMVSVAEGRKTSISGIADSATADNFNFGNITDRYQAATSIGNRYGESVESQGTGSITINSGTKTVVNNDGSTSTIAIGDGNVNLYFGNKEQGFITTGGDLTVTGTGDVYVDSDLDIGGDMTLTSTGADSEVLLTLTNIGKVQADRFTNVIESAINGKDLESLTLKDIVDAVKKAYPDLAFGEEQAEDIIIALKKGSNKVDAVEKLNNDIAVAYMHDFMHSFYKPVSGETKPGIYLNAASGDAKLTVDMWVENTNGSGQFNFEKYDKTFPGTNDKHTFKEELNNLNFTVNGTNGNAADTVYVEVSTGEQLKAIQNAGSEALGYNYALMGDINASDVEDYVAIGTESEFTGTFDGRGNRIIGLTVDKVDGKDTANAGIFDTIGTNGVVKDVNIYSGTFTGSSNAGAVAGVNKGRIEGIVTFGNTVTSDGNAGGIVGENKGNNGKIVTNEDGTITLEPVDDELPVTGIIDVESTGSVIAGGSSAVAGGLVGTNDGALGNSYSDSAVTVKVDNQNPVTTTGGLGGVVGVNTEKGNVQYVDSLGVTNGGATNSSNIGGIIGTNNGNMYSGYNESIVSGNSNVGGIIGDNNGSYDDTDTWTGGIVENVVNATGVTGTGDYVGGLVGTNIGSVENGRNNGTITGTNYVGGMVGSNADEHSVLANLTNDSAADISGENYVGGIAGTNSGTITAQNQSNLINRGSITGQNYVGGVAGENIGTIEYVKNDVNLYVKDDTKNAQYFGGVAGINGRVDDTATTEDETATGTITSATNEGDVVAENAQYVGGIVGWNTVNGKLDGMGNSNTGRVEGATYVGGVAGKNDADIAGTADNIITIENTGVVIAHNGGAGGIFGENTGDITYAEMSNSGIVSGTNYSGSDNVTNGTGGIIGVNSGDITYSSLKNEADGQVIGMENVGGLIGYNSGEITGGRTEVDDTDAGYYKYQIYNNGVINAGKWVDGDNSNEEGYGVIDSGEFTAATVNDNSKNIGGLIGNNAANGKLTAGYNTGAINAGSSTNVGGIAGSNSGTIDQVFNTVYNTDGTKGAITGGTNVGGLVGTNSGMLSNAYNITDVSGNYAGNAVGINSGTISNIYATNTTGQLIGSGYDSNVSNAYSFSANEVSSKNVIVISDQDDQKDSGSYDGFVFSAADVDGDVADWKNYDGYSNPLLKVFLTRAEYTGNESFTYNGQNQGLTISGNVSAADQLNAYNNASSLLQAAKNEDAGQDYLGIYSQQIAASGSGETFDPNNLGYDIDVTYDIDKATITINLDKISRDYGNSTITNVTSGGNNYGFNFGDMVLTDEMKAELTADNLGFTQTSDGAVDNLKDGQKTNNAGTYSWYANFKLSDTLSGNYQFDTKGADSLTSVEGVSKVNQVQLTIDLKDITRVYGNLDKADYEFIANGLVNGDNIEDLILTVTSDGAIVEGSTDNPLKTNVVGVYEWSATVSNISNNLNTNYIITIDASAKSTVTPAQLDIVLGNVSHVYGSPNLDDYKASFGNNGLVNGDSGSISINVGSVTDDALSTDKQYTDNVGDYHWNVEEGGLSANGFDLGNYTVHYVDKGNSKVTPAQLDIVLGDVSHVYGSPNLNGYAASFGNNNGLVNGDSGSISVNVDRVTDAALSTDKQYTNDVDNYHWTVGEGGLSADGFKLGNYAINFVNEGSSKVTKANLTININDVNMTYGDLENWISGQYGYNASDVDGQKLVNGDSLADVIAGMTYNNTAYNSDGTTKNVAEGNFAITNDDVTQGTKYGNYNITFNNGTVTMDKKQITIGANNEQILVGETPNYSGTDIDSVLVNGDSLNGNYYYGVADGTIESVVGAHNGVIGVWIGGAFYDLSQNVDWTQAGNFFSNYEVNYIPGTLTVSAYDIPEDWPHNRWNYLFNDAPFDRNKDFRERKAEVNFVDGGMEI